MRRALLAASLVLASLRGGDASALVNAGSLVLPYPPETIAVAGARAYVAVNFASGSSLLVIDVSDPSAPREVAELDLEHPAFDVAVVGSHAYVSLRDAAAFSGRLAVVDVSDPTAPALVGGIETSEIAGGGGDVEVAGGVAYLVTGGSFGPRGEGILPRLEVIDVSDPRAPALLGSFDLPTLTTIDVAGDRVFAFSIPGIPGIPGGIQALEVIDVSDPHAPVELARVPTQLPPADVVVRDGLAYLSSGFGLEVFDVSDASHPSSLGLYFSGNFQFPAGEVALKDGIAYLATGSGLRAIDVRDPEQPRPVGGIATDAIRFAIEGGFAYAIGPSELRVIDLSRPIYPLELGAAPEAVGATDVAVRDGLAYVAGSDGLRIVDVSEPAAPVGLGAVSTSDPAVEVAVDGPLAYLAADRAGLRVVDVSEPTAPVELGAFATPGRATDVALAGGLVYVATAAPAALHLVDGSDPRNPRELGTLPISPLGSPFDVCRVEVVGEVAYLSFRRSLYTIDVSDPALPALIASGQRLGLATDVALRESVAYVGGRNWIEGVDVTDPAMPFGRLFYALLPSERIAAVADFVYASGEEGLRVLDAIDPTAPRDLGGILESGLGAAVVDGRVYLAAGSDGLRIFDLGPEYLRPIPVELRLGPGRGRRPVNPRGHGVLTVELLGSADLDVSEVDPATLALGRGRASAVHVEVARIPDRHRDGFPDLLLQFRTDEIAIEPGDPEVCLRGETLSGRRLAGCAPIETVPARAHGSIRSIERGRPPR